MVFMVIEHFKDPDAIGQRFRDRGRLLPDDVTYHASWIDPMHDRCYQVVEADRAEQLLPWIDEWSDLVAFQVVPVVTSVDYWQQRGSRSA